MPHSRKTLSKKVVTWFGVTPRGLSDPLGGSTSPAKLTRAIVGSVPYRTPLTVLVRPATQVRKGAQS